MTTVEVRPADRAEPWAEIQAEARPAPRDWRDTVRAATDLALLGMLVSLAALPVVTAGAAVATGSAAVHHFLEYDRWPGTRACWAVFRRRLLSGLVATVGCVAAALLVLVDLLALRRGLVPGGVALMLLTLAVATVAAGGAGLVVGARGSGRRCSVAAAIGGPAPIAAAAGVVALAAVLAVLVHPVLVAVMLGYVLFALHVVARRLVDDRD